MPTFAYTARDLDGRAITGTLTGSDERMAREQLRSNNLYVTRIESAVGGSAAANRGAAGTLFAPRVKLYDLVVFSRQLATLVRAGLQLSQALHALSQQTRNVTLRSAVDDIRRDIAIGTSLTTAMKQHPRIFNELYLSLAEAGELGGMLDQTLDVAATALDKEMEIREKVKSAMVHPVAVLVVAWAVVNVLLLFVVPVFDKVYKQFKATLPPITQSLITLSHFLRSYWWMALLATVVLVVVGIRLYRTERGRRAFDAFRIKIPLMGHLLEKIGLARTAHTMAALVNAGVPLIRTLGTAGRVSGNALVVDAMGEVSVRIQEGAMLGATMAATGRFPLMMTRMIEAGEESGNLGEMLEQVAEFFDREVEYGLKRLMTLMEPILTVFLGIIVGFILLAMYSPIFNLGNVIK